MENKRKVLYLNWDGFAYYYYIAAHEQGLVPTIDKLVDKGVLFENAYSGIPSITNPMQTAMASGAYAGKTGNVKLYYDKKSRMVIEQRRENNAENIINALKRQGYRCASVQHFTFENNGTEYADSDSPYVYFPHSNSVQRFCFLSNLLQGKKIPSGYEMICPLGEYDFIAAYFDDLDTIGHNNGKLAPIAKNEEERIRNVLWRLNQLDSALGNFLSECSENGLYDSLSIFLLTDHGMSPFSFNKVSLDFYNDLLNTISGKGYTYCVLKAGEKLNHDVDVVLASAGMSLLLSFTDENVSDCMISELKKVIEDKPYVGSIMDKHELVADGSLGFCDLYISPRVPGIFKDNAPSCGATHDSLDESSQHIFSLMSGSGVKKRVRISRKVRNIDFASTMCRLLEADAPHDNEGSCIIDALEG